MALGHARGDRPTSAAVDPRHAGRAAPVDQLRVLPAQGRRGRGAALGRDPAAGAVRPDFVSVTYGAGGSTQDRTVRVTERIARETTLTPLAHLTCVGASVAALRQVVGPVCRERASATSSPCAATRRATRAASGSPHPEGLDHADRPRRAGARRSATSPIGVAAFPDVHPASPDLEHDVEVHGPQGRCRGELRDHPDGLRRRQLPAAARRASPPRRDLPITPGLMPVTNFKQIARMSELMGTPLPAAVVAPARGGRRRPGRDARGRRPDRHRAGASGCSPRARPGCTSSR